MLESVRMGSPHGHMFRTDIGTKSAAFTKLGYLPNRVPDETKHLFDSVLDIDTSKVLNIVGIFKLFLVVPMLLLGIVLISINSAEIRQHLIDEKIAEHQNTTQERQDEPEELKPTRIGNESLAPVWTGIMLAASAATDFIAVWRRRGSTIILHTLTSTLTFVASILCIEYDRLQMDFISQSSKGDRHWLKYRLYLACVVLASIAVAVGVLSIYVGSRMGALEESRLYMEREGKNAILKKKDKVTWLCGLYWFARIIGKRRQSISSHHDALHTDVESDAMSESSRERMFKEDRSPTNLVLAPQNLCQPGEVTVQLDQGRVFHKSGSTSTSHIDDCKKPPGVD